MDPEGSLPYSQEPATGLYSESDESSPQIPTLIIHLNYKWREEIARQMEA
jgi:hypothetical protein